MIRERHVAIVKAKIWRLTGEKSLIVAFIFIQVPLFAGSLYFLHGDGGSWQLTMATAGVADQGMDNATGTSMHKSGYESDNVLLCSGKGVSARSNLVTEDCDGSNAEQFRQDCDWGLVQKYRSKLETRPLEPSLPSSSLRCVAKDDRYCEARRIMLDTSVSDDVFTAAGQWTTTLKGIRPWDGNISSCDANFAERTIMLKPDSHANFYHGLCDFINVFASMHIPRDWYPPPLVSKKNYDPQDIQIMMAPYRKNSLEKLQSRFLSLYEPYTTRPIIALNRHWRDNSTLCFDDLVLGLNPRGGPQSLFYNMRVPGDCSRSRLFRDWSDFVTTKPTLSPRRNLAPGALRGKPVQFALMTRNSGKGSTSGTRHMLNQEKLIRAMQDRFGDAVNVTLLDFDWSSPLTIDDQVQAILEADILASIHGAGLAHLSFLPPWAVVYEIYDCGDGGCYSNLSRLAGVKYLSGGEQDVTKVKPDVEVKETSLKNPKFWNFIVDEVKFLAKVQEALTYIKEGNFNSPYYDECPNTFPRQI